MLNKFFLKSSHLLFIKLENFKFLTKLSENRMINHLYAIFCQCYQKTDNRVNVRHLVNMIKIICGVDDPGHSITHAINKVYSFRKKNMLVP
ncbi:MAG: hypothetical protein IGNPGNKH_00516 [Sodalis sp. Ffu]|nr:MAG: hypothetical protein IGNPGNKH_00516 [Sodalis sp. Ffu]